MTCERGHDLLHAYLDDELTLTEQVSFEQHLALCPECEQARDKFLKLRADMRQSELRFDLPPDVQRRLQAVARPMTFTLRRVFAIAASVIIVVLAGVLLLTRSNRSVPANELVDAHVRSLQADHLLDVASTDQHTVKPWFDGKLDFAPPVRDLASEGFPLVGGRLDYLHDHPVAALVYDHRKHQINLFIWPESGADEAIADSTFNGYQLLQWRHAGMRMVAVSDLNQAELKQFAELLR